MEAGERGESIAKHRLVCAEECWCESGERSLRARLRDLSTHGAFVRTPEPFPVGERLTLKFGLEGSRVEAPAIVRHSALGYGMGVEFLGLRARNRRVVHKYLTGLLERLGPAAYSRCRRAVRIVHRAPITVRGRDAEGQRFVEETETVDVSEIGARVVLRRRVLRGESVGLRVGSAGGGLWAQFRTVWQGMAGTSLEHHVGLELIFIDLWGIREGRSG